jgi:hypothetical protein
MFKSKTLAVAIVAFGFGSITSVHFPLLAALRSPASQIPIKATVGASGVRYERVVKDSKVKLIVLKTKDTVVAYELGRGYIYRGDKFGECGPPSECPLPPPCPPKQACPFQSVQVSYAK